MAKKELKRLTMHIMTIAAALFIAALVLFAFPAKVNAAGNISLCSTAINGYMDGKWHYAGQSGSPRIPGWKSGGFRLSTDGSTLYFDNFVFTELAEDTSTIIIQADRDMTVELQGNNNFGNNDFAALSGDASDALYDLTIQGESDSTAYIGKPDFGNMMTVRNLSVSGCTINSDAHLFTTDGTLDMESGVLNIPYIEALYANISGGTINCSRGFTAYSELKQSGGVLTSSDYIKVSGIYRGTNGKLTADNYFESDGALYLSGTIDVVSGKLDVKSNISVSENAKVKIESASNATGISAGMLIVTGGSVTGKGVNTGIDVQGNVSISGGTVYGESQSGSGIYFRGDTKITGGLVKAKRGSQLTEDCSAIKGDREKIKITGDMWISAPSDGYIRQFNGNQFGVFDADENLADEAVIQKVTGVSIGTRPTSVDDLYEGDSFDTDGTVFKLHFEDGSEADYTWNSEHAVNIGFTGIPDMNNLSAGNKVLNCGCFGQTTKLNFTVKKIGTPVLSGSVSGTTANLNWTKADGAKRYRVFVGETGSGSSSWVGDTTALSFNRRGLEPGKSYDFTVWAARNSDSNANESNVLTLTVPIEAPVLSVSETGNTSTKLSWRAVDGADQYEIYRKAGTGGFGQIATVKGLSVPDTGLVPGTNYTYYVVAVNSDTKVRSTESNRVSVSIEFSGAAVVTIENTGNGYELSWNEVPGATDYEVYRGDGEKGARRWICSTSETSFNDDSADSYLTYNYIVKAVRFVDDVTTYGGDSNVVIGKAKNKAPVIAPIVPPTKEEPAGTKFNLLQARSGKVRKTSIQIKWKKVSGAKKYIVYGNKCGTKNKYKKLVTTTGTSRVFTKVAGKKVKKGTYFKFIVYALDAKGKVISTSKTIHVATTGGKVGNDKKVTTAAKKGKVTLKKGKTFKLKAKAIPASKKLKVRRHRKIQYETSSSKIATVSAKGIIKAKGKGTCYVYAYTQNGVFAKVKVTVK